MGFMQSYKRLDTLCRDMNGVGVSGYIADMDQTAGGSLFVSGWNTDYRQLKQYRHIRNQIAHDVDATEEGLCSAEDSAWIEEFYQRILQQTDPLALYHKASLRQKDTQYAKAASCRKALQPKPSRTGIPPLLVGVLFAEIAVLVVLAVLLIK